MSVRSPYKRILVTGGAGYVGSSLVPEMLRRGHEVNVLDLYLFGENIFNGERTNPRLKEFKGDIRDLEIVREALHGCDAVIHLACISNDPSFELNPSLGRSINFDAFEPLVKASKDAGVKFFVYASSSSVYGVSESPDVNESHPLKPLTDYSKYKALCEPILLENGSDNFTVLILRPATVCGYSPRLRLDLTVNILTNHAVNLGKITVFGGAQLRPNIHIKDMVELYCRVLELPREKVHRKIYNAGYQNHSVKKIAEVVREVVGQEISARKNIDLITMPSEDNRSYHISSDKIMKELGFAPKHTIEDAVRDLARAFREGKVPNSFEDVRYFNIKTMQKINLQ